MMKFLLTLTICASAFFAQRVATVRAPECGKYQLPTCTFSAKPICATDNTVYLNECLLCGANQNLNQNVQIVKDGPCEGDDAGVRRTLENFELSHED
ncbi:trypsin inhibitor ClTI-1-like isoform X2 [Leucoraja erinacea]|uniref:trypsin inhibitor ClTI-1-like isoform X2 n=1 Tax=Leucoraja erinaceus TaxID=7782 RepID=UPI0024561A22|nr:trypsin inhibitor ClTI-1-like isoform X2 [Leucoraja erinacea]